MKTPDEIKKGLECCLIGDYDKCLCGECPYSRNGYNTLKCDVELGDDAIDYIWQLKREKVALADDKDFYKSEYTLIEAQVPRWISVEERLPEHDVRVLFGYARYGYVGIGHLDREEMDWLDSNEIQVARPSHWMPLLEAPKEDGGETR